MCHLSLNTVIVFNEENRNEISIPRACCFVARIATQFPLCTLNVSLRDFIYIPDRFAQHITHLIVVNEENLNDMNEILSYESATVKTQMTVTRAAVVNFPNEVS